MLKRDIRQTIDIRLRKPSFNRENGGYQNRKLSLTSDTFILYVVEIFKYLSDLSLGRNTVGSAYCKKSCLVTTFKCLGKS